MNNDTHEPKTVHFHGTGVPVVSSIRYILFKRQQADQQAMKRESDPARMLGFVLVIIGGIAASGVVYALYELVQALRGGVR